MAHTPTPWNNDCTHGDTHIVDSKGRLVAGTGGYSNNFDPTTPRTNSDNAAFIVRACNAHDELVSALKFAVKELLQHVDYGRDNNPVTYACDKLEMALAKAREGE